VPQNDNGAIQLQQTDPPVIVDENGGFYGRLTLNLYHPQAAKNMMNNQETDNLRALRELLEPAFMGQPSEADLVRMGYMRPFRCLPDGRIAALMEINSGRWAIVAGIHPYGHRDAWYYTSRATARAALEKWDGTADPQGWFRHPQSGRRRPDGDASREISHRW
jgi:hypothetical protein